MDEVIMPDTVIITGCSSGIGFATALEYARNGYVTYATMRDISKKEPLDKIAKAEKLPLHIVSLDVNNPDNIEKVISRIETEEGIIDVLVNNAGYGLFGSFEDTNVQEMREQFETDYFGAVRMIKAVLPLMRKFKSGKIVNVSSLAGLTGFPFCSSYVASKFALEGLVDSLRYELKKFGIQLALIEPGMVRTNFYKNKKIAKNALSDSVYSQWMKNFMKLGDEMFLKNSTAPEVVAKKIFEITKSEIMEPQYMIGPDIKMMITQKKALAPLDYEKFIEEYMLKSIY